LALVLCRTSRAFLPLGRRLLYRAPFASIPLMVTLKVTWDRAIALYDVLSRNNGVVGRIVRSLHGLEIWCRRLAIVAAPKGAHAFDLRSQSSKVFAWQASIVAACPALRAVSVEIQSTSEATAMHRALGPSMASLEDIKLSASSLLEAELALRVLANLYRAGCRLNTVELSSLDCTVSRKAIEEQSVQLKHPFENMILRVRPQAQYLKPFAAFFSAQVGVLRKLDLFVPAKVSQADLLHLFKIAGTSLMDLKLSSAWRDHVSRQYAGYGLGFDGPVFPAEAAKLFPRLERLTILNFGALSVERVGLLAQHCPNLQILIASGSIWLADNPALSLNVAPHWQKAIFPERRVAELLEAMLHLVQVNLGRLPVRETDQLPTLSAAMTAKRVALDYDTCIECCEYCGEYH